MNAHRCITYLLCLFALGCSCTQNTGTDAHSFILKTLSEYSGKKRKATSGQSLKNLKWTHTEDPGGVVVQIPGDSFAQVDQLIREVLGPPSEIGKNIAGFPKVTYYPRDNGFTVVYSLQDDVPGHSRCVVIIILRPPKPKLTNDTVPPV